VLQVARSLAPNLDQTTLDGLIKEVSDCEHNLLEVNEEGSDDMLDPVAVLELNYPGVIQRCQGGLSRFLVVLCFSLLLLRLKLRLKCWQFWNLEVKSFWSLLFVTPTAHAWRFA
jgi:hypothetical protein